METSTARWKRRPEGSTWGDYGASDQLGRLNLLTPEKVKEGVAEVREGLVFCLSLPLDYPGGNILNPRRHPPVLRPTLRNGKPNFIYRTEQENPALTDVINDDAVILHLQYSTQWDSLAHVGQLFDADGDGVAEPVFYNGYRAGEDVVGPQDARDAGAVGAVEARSTSVARKLGIENMAVKGMQGRGVMVDLHAHHGRARAIIGYDALMHVLDADKVEVERGDMVCLRTGFDEVVLEMNREPDGHVLENSCAALDGRDERLLQWISDSELVALISDNYAVEAHPSRPHAGRSASLPLHAHCLFKLGVNLGELWHLSPLADWLRAHGRSRFLLTAPPLRLPGAVGSPATPIATV
ncbi:MAG TPA: cyclase family protein [Alphaproteobacteria bacterium]|nr:cyclase family protein [Alphaproteobacteria bacterium]